jgi:Fe-S-cluster containining protein
VDRESRFSYQCRQCGLCCHDKVVTLSPYDVLRIARASGVTTGEAVRRYTMRRGSLLRFRPDGGCVALAGWQCVIHSGRPLACRLYPLGLERSETGERLIRLEPAPGSLGVFGNIGTAGAFLDAQGTPDYLAALEKYRALIPLFRGRVGALVDFDQVEPREFWRRAVAEALLELGFDPNPLIDGIFDPDGLGCGDGTAEATVPAHIAALTVMGADERDVERLAAAAVMLAVSLGYAPGEVILPRC